MYYNRPLHLVLLSRKNLKFRENLNYIHTYSLKSIVRNELKDCYFTIFLF